MQSMGMQMGLDGDGRFCKRQFRWMFTVDGVIGDESAIGGLQCLPPEKSARPNLSFKEMNAQHLIEEVFYPTKPDWKPITVTVFDLDKSVHPIWKWLTELYDAKNGVFNAPNLNKGLKEGFIRECGLKLFDGCGTVIEKWIFDDCWPQAVNFQTLDMSQNGLVMCDITLRYSRAYITRD
jgi:hypothetical protein